MSDEARTIPAYLRQAKSALRDAIERPGKKVTIVSGNQSADLDSMCSAILYAYMNTTINTSSYLGPTIPLLHIPQADLDIRPEFTVLFKRLGIVPSNLVTISDLLDHNESAARLRPEDTNWILVDHNQLEGQLAGIYGKRVSGVIDHHKDEEAVPPTAQPRRIEVCGSCSSLVIDHFRKPWDQADLTGLPASVFAEVAQLGLAAMLIDTKNLTNASKVRPVDKSSVAWCESLLRGPGGMPAWDRSTFYEELDAAKKDIDCLPLDGILRKDYKEWHEAGLRLGISSVVKPLEFVASKAQQDWKTAADAFMAPRQLDIWAVMTGAVDPASNEFSREIYIQWVGEQSCAAVESFKKNSGDSLQLKMKSVRGMDGPSCRIWQQGDTTQTRKQVAPYLREAIGRTRVEKILGERFRWHNQALP